MANKKTLNKATFTLVALLCLINLPIAKAIPQPVTWNNWTFDYDVSGNFDGLSLANVRYQGINLYKKISLPVMRVFYTNNACGPYADRLGDNTLSTIDLVNNQTISQRQFELNGRQWYEIGFRDQIGSYDIYQVYYLSNDGIIDAHIFSKGLQCNFDHIHYPSWRIDVDVDGPANDVIEQLVGNAYQVRNLEFKDSAASATNHGWRIRDTASNLYVDMLPGFPDFSIPNGSTNIPVSDYVNNTIFGRLYKPEEDITWTAGPNQQVPYDDGENLNNTDIVAWYEGYMPHSSAEGSEVWHSTGVRLVSSLTPMAHVPQPDVIVESLTYDNGIYTCLIKNQGSTATPADKAIGVGYSVDNQYHTWGGVKGPLAAGATVTVKTNGRPYVIPNVGDHTITAFVDSLNRFPESNEANNKLTINQYIATPSYPDVVVTSLTYDSSTGKFTSDVKNQGITDTPTGIAIGIAFFVDDVYKTWGTIRGTLAPGSTATFLTFGTPYFIPSGTHKIKAYVDSSKRFAESDEANNMFETSITIP